MARMFFRFGSALALAAGISMAASPALARDRWRHHHDHGVDAGDVLAGVLIIGGIAAIASAASKSDRDRRERDYRDADYREPYDDRPEYRPEYAPRSPSSAAGDGIGNAVDLCVGEVERGDDRVASVDNAARTRDGWRISGQLGAGGGFSCWIDNDGRIRNVDLAAADYGASYNEPAEGQWNDEDYARARAARSGETSEIDGDLAAADY